jgi:hypothetical protein
MSLALATAVVAGPAGYPAKSPKNPVAPMAPPPTGCNCFGPGATFDVFGGGILPAGGGKDALGGGVGVDYFFNRYLGVDLNYGVYATNSEHHEFDGNLVLRLPIDSLCIAPYAIAGGGYSVNSVKRGNWDVGGGIDIRIPSSNCLGIFAEGAYHFAEKGDDYATVRLGLRVPF